MDWSNFGRTTATVLVILVVAYSVVVTIFVYYRHIAESKSMNGVFVKAVALSLVVTSGFYVIVQFIDRIWR